jgi:lysophospholipase L1-like esterase
MAYTNIISRKLNVECVNYGFSGNGRMESALAELLSEIDASFFVIDCLGNMLTPEIRKNTHPLVETIRSKHPSTPIVFVEGLLHERSFLDDTTKGRLDEKNRVLRSEYDKMLEKGFTNIFYVDGKGALGDDHEGTVDGVHFTDLGFIRFADYLISKFEQYQLTVTTPNKN